MNAPKDEPRLFGVRPYRPDGSMDMETLTYAQAIQDSGRFNYRWVTRKADRVHLEFLEADRDADACWQSRCACGWSDALPLTHRQAWCGDCNSAAVVTKIPAGWRWAGDSRWDLERAREAGATEKDPKRVWERHTIACLFGKAIKEGLKLYCASALPLGVHVYYPEDERQPDASGFDDAAAKVAALRAKNGDPAQAAGYPPLGTIRDAFTAEDLKGTPFEPDDESERMATEKNLRAGLTATNGTTPHVDPEPTVPPHPAVAFDATTGKAPVSTVLFLCPVCQDKSAIQTKCGSCGRSTCWRCVTGDRADPGPCIDCNTAEENADVAPPFLADKLCQKAREILDLKWKENVPRAEQLEAALLEVGAEVLGRGPLGWLLKFDGAVFRLNETNIEAWLRGDLTVGLEEDEDQGEEEGSSFSQSASEPAPASTSPAGVSSNPGEEAPGTSSGSSGCKAAADSPTPPSAAGGVPSPEPPASSSLPEAPGPAATPPEAPVVQSPAEASGGGAPTPLIEPRDPRWEPKPGDVVRWGGLPEHEATVLKVDLEPNGYGHRVFFARGEGSAYGPTKIEGLGGWRHRFGFDVGLAPTGEVVRVASAAVDAVLTKDGVGPADPVAERKALGLLWLDTKRHQATKKAPEGRCLLCDQAFARGEFYRVGKKALGKGFSHDSCVARLVAGKDPKVNERHQIEREAIDRLTPAAAGGEGA